MTRSPRPVLRRVAVSVFAFGLATYPLAAAAAAFLYVLLAPRRRAYRDAGALALIGLFGGLSAILSPSPIVSFLSWLEWLAMGLGFVLVAQRWSRDDAIVATGGLALGLLVTLGQEWRQRAVLGVARPEGFTIHPNVEAALLLGLVGSTAAGWALLSRKRNRWHWLLPLAIAVGLAALVMTGSRSGLLGLLVGGIVWLGLYLGRFSWRRLLPWAVGVVVVLALLVVVSLVRGAGSQRNLLQNSGFEHGDIPWVVSPGAAFVEASASADPAGGRAVRLAQNEAGQRVLLRYDGQLHAHPGERFSLSLYVDPSRGSALRAFVRVEAEQADGTFISRAGKTGWTIGDENEAGGRMVLPTGPAGRWERVAFTLPPLPPGTAFIGLAFVGDGKAGEAYGEVDAVQLQKGTTATGYVPGGRPGLGAVVAPVARRVRLAMRDPTIAAGGRLAMWWTGLRIAADRPVLGYGPGSEIRVVKEYALDFDPAPLAHFHDSYLKILIEGGSVTLAAFLAWLGLVALRLFRRVRAGSPAAAVGLATLVALLVASVFDRLLSWPAIAFSLWLAICSGLYGDEDVQEGAAGHRIET